MSQAKSKLVCGIDYGTTGTGELTVPKLLDIMHEANRT